MKFPSRLLFAAGLLPLVGLADQSSHLVYVGPLTRGVADGSRGIYSLRLDGATGKLTKPVLVAPTSNPMFLAISPDHKNLYATVKLPAPVQGMSGGVEAYAINAETGALNLLNQQSSGGEGAAHLTVDRTGRALFVAHYSSGTVTAFTVLPDGRTGVQTSTVSFSGSSGVNAQRQKNPHPHSVAISPDNHYVYVPLLGQDKVARLSFEAAAGQLKLADGSAHVSAPGAGPRHATFSSDGKFYYSLNELVGSVDVSAYDAATGVLTAVQTISGLPAGFNAPNTSAEIRVHPNGKFVYSSNRGHDSLAVFARDEASGRLTLIEITPCGGQHPRNFALSPDGAWLLCANRDTHNLVVFAVDAATGRLTKTGEEVAMDSPVCVLFVN